MKLYGVGLSRSFRVLWALEELKYEYEYIEIKFGSSEPGGNGSNTYRDLNSQGKVPTLVDDDFVLGESAAILNYLGTKKPSKGLVPADGSVERAKYDELCYFILTELEQPLWLVGKHRFVLPQEYRISDRLTKTTEYEFQNAQEALLCIWGNRPYALGDKFTMADILLAHTIAWAERFNFSVEEPLLKYRKALSLRDGFTRAMDSVGGN